MSVASGNNAKREDATCGQGTKSLSKNINLWPFAEESDN